MKRTVRGTSMVECAAALMLAGLVTAELGGSLHASTSILTAAAARAAALDVARNLLESELGSPCGPPYVCPSDFVCAISRTAGVGYGLDRFRAWAAARRAGPQVEFSVLARPADCS